MYFQLKIFNNSYNIQIYKFYSKSYILEKVKLKKKAKSYRMFVQKIRLKKNLMFLSARWHLTRKYINQCFIIFE